MTSTELSAICFNPSLTSACMILKFGKRIDVITSFFYKFFRSVFLAVYKSVTIYTQ